MHRSAAVRTCFALTLSAFLAGYSGPPRIIGGKDGSFSVVCCGRADLPQFLSERLDFALGHFDGPGTQAQCFPGGPQCIARFGKLGTQLGALTARLA